MIKNNYLKATIVSAILLLPMISSAEVVSFDMSLGFGRNNPKAEVMKLQQFLGELGLLKVAPTGNYLNLTVAAVKAFQNSQGIESTGFFGPLSRAAANRVVSSRIPSEVSSFSVSPIKGANLIASVVAYNTKEVNWETKDYPAGAGVNINLLRKVSDNPVGYVLVRQIAKDTPNDGSEILTIDSKDGEKDSLYMEVTCSTTYSYQGECRFSGKTVKVF